MLQFNPIFKRHQPFLQSIKVLSTVCLALSILNGCGPVKKTAENQQLKGTAQGFKSPPQSAGDSNLYAPIAEPGAPVGLGFGIDLNNHSGIPNKCIDGKMEVVPQQEGYLSLDADYTVSELETALGVESGGSVSFLKWGASARGHFAHKSREKSYGLNYVVFAYNKHHSKVFIPSGRSDTWKSSSQEEWLASCGAGYVAAQDYGSMLIVKFSLTLNDRIDEKSWGGSASGNYFSFAKLRASIDGNSKSKKSSGTLSVSAIQIGGKPEELGKLLKTGTDTGMIESFALCDVYEVKACLAGLRSIENYISTDFPKQIEDQAGGGAALLTTYPFRYPKNFGSEFNPGLDQFVLKARKDLASLYDQEMADLSQLKAFARKDDKDAQDMITHATSNVAEIRAANELCFKTSTYKQCADRAEAIAIACAETVVPEHFGVGESGEGNNGNSSGE